MKTYVACIALSLVGSSFADDTTSAGLPVRVREGFKVERVYQVPRETEGSWVALTVDPRGRLIASDQTGSLYRIDPEGEQPIRAERIELPIGHAHGLLFAFDSLYAVVAENEHQGPGLYRIRDTNADDVFDQVTLLQSLDGTGEHGPHSVVLSPDGKSLFVAAGNKTKVPDAAMGNSLVPRHWGEDDLLPRLWGPIGSEVGTPAPGGWIARTDPNGQQWQLHAVGFRNGFDLAFNPEGEMFTVDADAEFDLGTPWYQPTRVFHVVAGTDYGWRSGAGKWQPHYADTLPPVVELGTGSPTGITFAHGAAFPRRYQNALFVGDWSRGRIVAVHLAPGGSSYRGTVEEIVSGTPLPVTDLLVHPKNGSIYFTVGGRGTTSGLYRLYWEGNKSDPNPLRTENDQSIDNNEARSRDLSRRLRTLYRLSDHGQAIRQAWPHLAHSDRTIRHTARIVLEHVPHQLWQDRAFLESDPQARMTALLAMARSSDSQLLPRIIDSLSSIDWNTLAANERQTLLRCFYLALTRLCTNPLDDKIRRQAVKYLEPQFPAENHALNIELLRLLVFLDSPHVPELALQQIGQAVTPQQRLAYAVSLRHQRSGWTAARRTRYFSLLGDATTWRGGKSLSKYIELTATDALLNVPADERGRYERLTQRVTSPTAVAILRPIIRAWSLGELTHIDTESRRRADPTAGRRYFAEAKCFACHRFRGEGGAVGPDLTTVAKRLSTRDLLEAIVEPDRFISDQFSTTRVLTKGGRVLTGRIVNLKKGALLMQTDMLDPANLQQIKTDDIERMQTAPTSMMPKGLLDTLTHDQIIDLIAFLTSER